MKTQQLIAVLALTAATGAAFAQTAAPAMSSPSRAAVITQVQQAHARGHLLTSNANYPFASAVAKTPSRAEIAASLSKADQAGQLLTSAAAYPFEKTTTVNVSRAQVKAELVQAMAHDTVAVLNQGA